MTDGRARNAWLRVTDVMGLTEPGRRPLRPHRRLLLLSTVIWSLLALGWLTLVIRDLSEGTPDYLRIVLVVIWFVLAVTNFVMWRKSGKSPDDSNNAS
jgi:hypothetical protein